MSTSLTETQITTFTYQKDGGDPEVRTAIVVRVPSPNITAIDVADMPADAASDIVDMLIEYKRYHNDCMSRIYNFETWVEHTLNKSITPKWRSFKLDNITDVK